MSKNRIPTTRKDTSAKAKFAKKVKNEKTKPGTGVFDGIPYESFNELHFLYWVAELKKAGYIEDIQRAPSYVLTDGFTNVFTESNKRNSSGKSKTQLLLRPSVYTPEFVIKWNTHKYKDFVWVLNSGTKYNKSLIGKYIVNEKAEYEVHTWIECKSHFDFQNTTRLFINNQKFMFKTHGIFVNLVKIPDFFQKTFTPAGYLKTNTGKPRKLKFEYRTLNQFLTQ